MLKLLWTTILISVLCGAARATDHGSQLGLEAVKSSQPKNVTKLDLSETATKLNLPKNAKHLEPVIVKACKRYKLDCKVYAAILQVESNYRLDAVNSVTQDYGIAQVNIKNIEAMGACKDRMLVDAEYAIDYGARVLSYFQRRYAKSEPGTWFCRYNVGTQKLDMPRVFKACEAYRTKVVLAFDN